MKLAFLQNLENLSLDGETFLAQFLEFLLDRSLIGNKKYDSLIWSTAQVLDLKLPISTVSSAFALLQVKISENQQNNQNNNQKTNFVNSQSNSNSVNSNSSNSNIFPNSQNLSQNAINQKNNLANLTDNYPQNSNQNSQKLINFLNPNCIQKVDLEQNSEEDLEESNSQKDSFNQNTQTNQNSQNISKTKHQFSSANSLQNLENNQISNSQNLQIQDLTIPSGSEIPNQNPSSNSKNVSLSQVHAFLINRIKNSKEMNLKLLLTDLALEKIDLEAQTGILTLSSGALLNFLKNKKSLDWISQNLEEEFGWKVVFVALQRETKTILFPNDTILPITKINYQGNLANSTPNQNSSNNSSFNSQTNETKNSNNSNNFSNNYSNNSAPNLANSTTKNQSIIDQNISKSNLKLNANSNPKEVEKAESINNKSENSQIENGETEKKFYKLYSKNGDFPFNFADKNVDLISNIPIAKTEEINWEEFADEFELE